MKPALILTLALISQSAFAQVSNELKQKLMIELNFVANFYENFYAPKAWKERHLGWSLQNELTKSQAQIMAAQSVYDYRQAVASLINSTADYHVSYSFLSTESATLPFQVKTVENQTLIVNIDRSKLPFTVFSYSEGDELVAMDGKPVAEIRKDLIAAFGKNVPSTDEALADLTLTRRRGSRNNLVPRGPVTLTFKKQGQKTENTYQLVWEYTPESIPGRITHPIADEPTKIKLASPMMQAVDVRPFSQAGNGFSVGVKESMLPNLGTILWEAPETSEFRAYIYKNAEGKLLGFVRIPNYTPDDASKAVKDFSDIIRKMEPITEGLVIDQLNNPGGSVFYLYALASHFSSKSLTTPRHRMMLTPSGVKEANSMLAQLSVIKNNDEAIKAFGASLGGYPMSYQLVVNIREYCRFIIDQWKEGKKLTDPFYVWGVDQINPSLTLYTKPVVLLVNELDFSGGDFFPAILQDNKRVTVIGTRTAGAGGYVEAAQFPNHFGIETISYTGSIAERLDTNPIENLGVTPDVKLPFTADDLRGQFRNYLKEVNKTLMGLIK